MPSLFPYRELFAGDFRGLPVAALRERCGTPNDETDIVWVYRFDGDGSAGDPRKVIVQFMIEDGHATHAHLHLFFQDGLEYQEILW